MEPCELITSFETYEECAKQIMEMRSEVKLQKFTLCDLLSKFPSFPIQSGSQMKPSCRFEKYFVNILREHPVLYDENHNEFGREFPTKHAWSIVAGYMMMESRCRTFIDYLHDVRLHSIKL